MEQGGVVVVQLTAGFSENSTWDKGTAFMEYVKSRDLNLDGIIISLKFSLAHELFIINKENMYSEYTYERV